MAQAKINPDDLQIAPCTDVSGRIGVGIFCGQELLKTPEGNSWILLNAQMAESVLAEFNTYGVLNSSMPEDVLSKIPYARLALLSIDWVPDNRRETIDSILRYVDTDLLCYRANGPTSLCQKQQELWDPLLSWARLDYGLDFQVTNSLLPIRQNADLLEKIELKLKACDDFTIAGIRTLTEKTKSIIVSFALMEDVINYRQGVKITELEDLYRKEYWGENEEDRAELAHKEEEIKQIVQYLHTAREGHGNSSKNS